MIPQEIRTAILASPTLRAAVEAGDDQSVARLLSQDQPKARLQLRLDELALLELYTPNKYADALAVLAALRASTIPLAQLVSKFMQPGTHTNPDFGLVALRNLLTTAAPDGLGLTNNVCRPILDAGVDFQRIAASEVSEAVAAWRPSGKIGLIPGDAS